MAKEIINRIALSPLVSYDLADLYVPGERTLVDIKDQLFRGMILREKDFREFIKTQDWSTYAGQHVAITCSVDAIIPMWAYMLLTTALKPHAATIVYGNLEDLETELFKSQLRALDTTQFEGKKVVVKGCGDIQIPTSVFVEFTGMLQPIVEKLMFGEPCSSVPVFRQPKSK